MEKLFSESSGYMRPGQDLVIAGTIAIEGILYIVENRQEELLERYSGYFLRQVKQLKEYKICGKFLEDKEILKISDAMLIGDGGIMGTLWHMSESWGTGITIELKAIPIKQEVVEICEVFDLNPYRLRSGGSYLLATDHGGDLVSALKEKTIPAVVIGKVTKGMKRLIINGDNCSYLDKTRRH